MSYTIGHWSGQFGNNIQQTANAIMLAESKKTTFEQNLDHEIIRKFKISFGDSEQDSVFSGRFFAWQQWYNSTTDVFEGGNEIGLDKEYLYANMRRVCKDYIAPNLNVEIGDPFDDDTIVIHLRSGDLYHKIFDPPTNYIPNPLVFYLNLIDSFKNVIIVTQSDRSNPLISELEKIDRIKIQHLSNAEDISTLMRAKHVGLSGIGTFAMAAALCSSNVTDVYTTDLLLTENLNHSIFYNTDVIVHEMELEDYIKIHPHEGGGWYNTEEQRNFIVNYGLNK
jgi:hypothetical protein